MKKMTFVRTVLSGAVMMGMATAANAVTLEGATMWFSFDETSLDSLWGGFSVAGAMGKYCSRTASRMYRRRRSFSSGGIGGGGSGALAPLAGASTRAATLACGAALRPAARWRMPSARRRSKARRRPSGCRRASAGLDAASGARSAGPAAGAGTPPRSLPANDDSRERSAAARAGGFCSLPTTRHRIPPPTSATARSAPTNTLCCICQST